MIRYPLHFLLIVLGLVLGLLALPALAQQYVDPFGGAPAPPPAIDTGDPLANGIISAVLYLFPLILGWIGGQRSGRYRTERNLHRLGSSGPVPPRVSEYRAGAKPE